MNYKNKIRSFLSIERIVLIVSILIIFFIGVNIVGDYGVSVDEPVERVSSLMLYQTVFPGTKITAPEYENSTGNYWNRYYMAIQLPVAIIEGINNFELSIQQVYLLRHLYTFLLFLSGLFVFYKLVTKITGEQWLGIIGMWMLVFSPRIFGEAFYNIKDIPALVTCIFSLYFGIRFLEKSSMINMILFAAFGALFTNTRIVGAILIISCLIVYMFNNIRQKNWKRGLVYSLLCGLSSLTIYIVLSPNMWDDIIGNLLNTVSMFASYDHNPVVFYMGEELSARNLPWHYLFVWIFISTPLVYLVFSLFGMFSQLGLWFDIYRKKKEIDLKKVYMLFPFLTLLIPVMYFIVMRPVIYNGWRHFYFLYPIIILYAVFGIETLGSILKKLYKYVPLFILGISMLLSGIWMIQSHPYQFLYFNPAVRTWGYDNFEKDYWSVTERDLLQWICDNDSRDQAIKVGNACMSSAGEMLLYEGNRKRLQLHSEILDADYVYNIYANEYAEELFPYQCMYDEVYNLNVDKHTIGCVMKRKYRLYSQSELDITPADSKVYYNLNGAEWEYNNVEGRHILTGVYKDFISTNMLSVHTDNLSLLENIKIEISSDGEVWKCLNDQEMFTKLQTQVYLRMNSERLRYVRISFDNSISGDLNIKCNLYKSIEDRDTDIYMGKIVGIDANFNPELASLAMDFLDESSWTTGVLQSKDMKMDIYFSSDVTIEYFKLTQGGWGGDYPKNLLVYMSDGLNMHQISYETDDNITFDLNRGRGTALRLILGDINGTENTNWAIYEAKIFTAVPMY